MCVDCKMLSPDPVLLPFSDIAALMGEGSLTSEALVRECLGRIERDDDALHAFVEVFATKALSDARRLDAERAKGKLRGPLHGIPVAIKDLADIRGHVTGFGSRSYSTRAAQATAPFVQRLEAAGMVVLGKTQMVEFAFGSWGTNAVLGAPRNPRAAHAHYVAGGSSSGSAVAVAGGLVPAAIGSDTGGSIRIPASLCGIVGLKTTVGLIDMQGVAPLSPTFDTLGPLTNHVEDARLIFEAMRNGAPAGQQATFRGVVRVFSHDVLEPLDPEVSAAQERALRIAQDLGWAVQPIKLPHSFAEFQAESGAIMAREAFLALGHLVDNLELPLDPFVRSRVAAGGAITEERYAGLLERRRAVIRDFETRFGPDEIMLLPTTPLPAQPFDEVDESVVPMSRLTRLANYLGLCGISVPMGLTSRGLPVGSQLVARGGQEAMLLDTAQALARGAGVRHAQHPG